MRLEISHCLGNQACNSRIRIRSRNNTIPYAQNVIVSGDGIVEMGLKYLTELLSLGRVTEKEQRQNSWDKRPQPTQL